MRIKNMAKSGIIFIFTVAFFSMASAYMELNAGEVQLSVAGILLDIEGSIGSLDQIAFSGDSFDITMNNSQRITISSSDRRTLAISPNNSYVSKSCTSSKSSLALDTSSISGPIVFTITVSSDTCSIEGSGVANNLVVPNLVPIVIATTPLLTEIITPAPETTPTPTLEPIPEPAPVPIPEPLPPPIEETTIALTDKEQTKLEAEEEKISVSAQVTAEAVQAVSSGASEIINSVGSGAAEIYQGIATGSGGDGIISSNEPNIGIFSWNTAKPLTIKPGSTQIKLENGGEFKISIISISNSNIQDSSDNFFKVAPMKSTALMARSIQLSSLLDFNINTALAQGNNIPSIKILYPNGGEFLEIGKIYDIRWESRNLPSDLLVDINIIKNFNFTETVTAVNQEMRKVVKELRTNPIVTSTIKNVSAPTSVGVATAGASVLAVSASSAGAAAFDLGGLLNILNSARFYLIGIVRFRRKKPWGRVSDALTGKPLSGTSIQIYDAEFDKLKDAQQTDAEGRFSALIGIGKYYLKISKKGFGTQQTGIIEITSADDIPNLDITLAPESKIFSLETIKKLNLFNAIRRILEALNPYLLALGTILSLIGAALVPNTLNLFTLAIYSGMDLLKIYFTFHFIRPFGTIKSQKDNSPLPLSVVRIFNEKNNFLLATKVTDSQGRFNFLLAPGRYYLTCSKFGFAPHRSEGILIEKSGLVSMDILLVENR